MQPDQKIKICHLSSVHKATDTRIFYKECRSLASEYEVVLIAQSSENYKKDGVKIIGLDKPKSRLYRFLFTDIALLGKAINVNADLYHFHDPELIWVGLILRSLGKKIIYDVHEEVVSDFDSKKWLPFKSLAKSIYKIFESLAIKYFYFVLAESAYVQRLKNRTSKYVVVQNFVTVKDLDIANKEYKTNANTLAFVGYLSARRGLAFILEALAILKKQGTIISVRCIGEVNAELEEILNENKCWPEIKDQVDFKGYIPFPKSIHAVVDCMAGLALPETLPNHEHSYPTKMFEYMAIGLPVIASDFPLYKDVIEKYNCGITVTPENPEAIANAIETLYLNREMALKMSGNAQAAVKNFDWETEEKKLLDFYKLILNKN